MRYGSLLALLVVLPAVTGPAQGQSLYPFSLHGAYPFRVRDSARFQRLPAISSQAPPAGQALTSDTYARPPQPLRYPISSVLRGEYRPVSSTAGFEFYPIGAPAELDSNAALSYSAYVESSNSTPAPCAPNPYGPGCNAGCQTCGDSGSCESCTASCWYADFSALLMTRDVGNRLWTTYETGNNPNQLAYFPNVDWRGGGELRVGREMCGCGGPFRVEAVYWAINGFNKSDSITHASGVSSPLIFNDIEFSVGDPVPNYFDGAAEHRLWRTNEIHNFELNVARDSLIPSSDSGFSLDIWAGLRYFRFDERVRFGSVDAGSSFGASGGTTEAYLDDRIVDNLFGTQIGFQLQWETASGIRFYLAPQTGLYVNYIENRLQLYRGDGTLASPTAASGVVGSFPISSSTTAFSVLAQLDMGLEWQINDRWSAGIGYRIVAVSGIGLADMQIPTYVVDLPEIAEIDHNGDLLLHGALLSLERRF
ncbi:MAG: BBP7 family outer membrane beta-barrel protein [Planctomycetes bacterium]|nr:BBP7 family outer membrane beta-barrel protein [Planctomycetota bacterium]